jgi:ribosomal protein L11 methyltransferase
MITSVNAAGAFGTGCHPTTQLCVEAIEEVIESGERVLDWGAGSGILALTAIRVGASRVLSVDIDPLAVEVARRNVRANRLARRIRVSLSSLPSYGTYDGVVANICHDTIIGAGVRLCGLVRRGGWLVVSGTTLRFEERLVRSLAAAEFHLERMRAREGWVALTLRRAP